MVVSEQPQEKLKKLVSRRYTGDVYGYEPEADKTITKEAKKVSSKSSSTDTGKVSAEEKKKILSAEKEYKEALAYIKDAIAPAYMHVYPDKLRINNT
ncbi:hypothetical protein LAT59_04985, partial [Candidatus Gracilibacteria bacterium]|nr:hypothetical protein [Candidatus Gracilibacteria bacterium]